MQERGFVVEKYVQYPSQEGNGLGNGKHRVATEWNPRALHT